VGGLVPADRRAVSQLAAVFELERALGQDRPV
jgi:hypothetical protein